MSPDHFDAMGPDLHACLTTFQLHPATALALPPRPAHIKSAMRLRKAPPLEPELPPIPRAQRRRRHSGDLRLGGTEFRRDKNGNKGPLHGAAGGVADAYAAVAPLEGSVEACEGAEDDDDDGPVCENAQHFAWFLLTSACLSKGAQGEVMHRERTGAPCGVTFKNVELGVLFHSSPDLAYHAAPLPDCSCFSCRRRRRRRRRQGGRGRPHAASSARTRVGEVAAPPGHSRKARTPRPIPLPVPFCTDSEAYADPGGQSPHVRFPPHMHTLQDARPWSAEVHNLLQSEVKEAQFA